MLKNREELEKILHNLILENSDLRIASNTVKKLFLDKGISASEFNDIWTFRKSLDSIDMPSLFLLTKGLYSLTDNKNIALEEWFTEVEIRDGNNYTSEIIEEEKIEYPINIENVLKGKDDQFIFYTSSKFIKLLYNSGKIPYNYDTQRNPKIKTDRKTKELVKTININPDSVNKIAQEIEDNTFITNCITLNLLQDGTDSFEYNEKKRELIIKSGQINPIDGFHRIQGMLFALANDPDLEYITEVRFTNWDITRCRQFIGQEDKRNKIDKRYMNSVMNVTKWGNKVTSGLNSGIYDLRGKIVTDIKYINKGKALTMYDIMSNTIDELYDIKTNKEMVDTTQWIGSVFDVIIGTYPDQFISEIVKTKETSVINMPMMVIGYIALSKFLQHDEDWEEKLTIIMDSIDFNIENSLWEELGVVKNKKQNITYTKPIMTRITDYFKKVVGDINV